MYGGEKEQGDDQATTAGPGGWRSPFQTHEEALAAAELLGAMALPDSGTDSEEEGGDNDSGASETRPVLKGARRQPSQKKGSN